MEKYESKQCQIFKSAAQIYPFISSFNLLTPAVADKVEEWQATEDTCSFKIKGFTVKLRMVDKVYGKHVKISGDDGGVPIDFAFWIQLHEVTPTDTRIR
ncbi:MAG: polyketide cyclase, partial [Alistipes sp.]|nr:polyketide cyclase [Alistipes sp.]